MKGKVKLIGLLLARQVGEISAETIEDIKKLPIASLAPKAICGLLAEITVIESEQT
jgi:hypothetical protein